jgi:hypothetical protein
MSASNQGNGPSPSEEISRAYRAAAFDETPPEHLDRAILAAARHRRRLRMATLLPPLALAATVVLAFSIVLRIGVLQPEGARERRRPEPAPVIEALRSAPEREQASPRNEPELAAGSPARPSSAAALEPATIDAVSPGEPALRAAPAPPGREADAAEQDRAWEAQADVAGRTLSRQRAATAAPAACPETDRDEPALWLQCIAAHLAEGRAEIAGVELDAFLVTYPDYPLSEDLEALRTR